MNRTVPQPGVAAVMLTAVALLAGCSANVSTGAAASSPATRTTRTSSDTSATGIAPPNPRSSAQPQALPVDPGAGSRPQTQQFPSTRSKVFRNAMTDVWLAVTTGNPSFGRPAFFPEAAYVKVKAVGNPEIDWTGRLWLDFELDVAAAHRIVGSHARLVRVDMAPSSEAAWVPPGYCYNYVGYWHINGARLVYDAGGQERSIGIASLISWRGVWYVVHFGGVIRPAVGIVDDPEIGPGVPGPAGGC
ncbi:MAG TPA: hypothetical protein VF070_07620 [Streptosporangiaceae bacterium]